ncbi:hypothetical protein [Paenibacillus cisolokensis]|uniref:hypothetical protein n=1 Tax=Paenibacillus cisolokensis TaxID=1658519 RepID=UPI001BCF3985|nr:hypothetical protein [Paenibacillus cisolokensis]
MNRYSVSSLRFWPSDAFTTDPTFASSVTQCQPRYSFSFEGIQLGYGVLIIYRRIIEVDEIAVLIIEHLDFARFPGNRQASGTAKQRTHDVRVVHR